MAVIDIVERGICLTASMENMADISKPQVLPNEQKDQ